MFASKLKVLCINSANMSYDTQRPLGRLCRLYSCVSRLEKILKAVSVCTVHVLWFHVQPYHGSVSESQECIVMLMGRKLDLNEEEFIWEESLSRERERRKDLGVTLLKSIKRWWTEKEHQTSSEGVGQETVRQGTYCLWEWVIQLFIVPAQREQN